MMKGDAELYRRYTTTCALAGSVKMCALLAWSIEYFRVNFARHLPTDRKARILEMGCGYGRYLKAMETMGYGACYGIDLSEEQVRHAIELGLSNVEHADALEWLADKREEFDCILALDLLEHLRIGELVDLLRMVSRALKLGGTLVIQVPNGMAPLNPFIFADLTHVRAFTVQSLHQLLLLAGLTPEGYYETRPVRSTVGLLRRIAWALVLRPAIDAFVHVAYGRVPGRVYTANLIAVARR